MVRARRTASSRDFVCLRTTMPRVPLIAAALLAALLVPVTTASADAIDDHERSWLHRTLAFQYELGAPLPLRNAPWIGTHNSYNSTSEPGTLSGQDPNQQLSLTDQLRLDVRSLELDAHRIATPGGRKIVLCHGRSASEGHAGCTTERPMAERLAEVRAWLDSNPREVLLIYLEDHLEDRAGHEAAAAELVEAFGDDLYRTRARDGACRQMPMKLTRRKIRRAGAQVLVISGCGPDGATAWRDVAFGDDDREEHESGPEDFEPYPACDPGRGADVLDAHFVRVYEDSTQLSSTVGGTQGSPPVRLTPERTRELDRCGVDLLGFDQLTGGDPRLEALAWSWAEGQPKARTGGACAVQRLADGRWRTKRCVVRKSFACRHPQTRRWGVDLRRGRFRAGSKRRCPGDFRFAKPRTANEAQLLRDAMRAAGVRSAWVKHRR